MTDKPIIIDDVPVQDCCYFDYENDGYKDSCYIHQNECSAQNCYYKQLKRKEQECEELEEELNDLTRDIKTHLKVEKVKLDQLKQTLAEIKEIAKKAGNTQYLTFPDFNLQQNAKMLMGQFNGYLQQILQKISECEVENEN